MNIPQLNMTNQYHSIKGKGVKIILIEKKRIVIIKDDNYEMYDGDAGYIATIADGKIESILDVSDSTDSLKDYLPKNKKSLVALRDFLNKVIENIE